MKPFNALAAAAVLLTATGMAAAQTQAAQTNQAAAAASAPSGPMTDGEVRKVDKEAGKVTLRHGPLENLGMPGMTMVFRVVDPKMLETLKEGDKVKFSADRINGAFTVTSIEGAR
jgi:Cu/Ag efflux protein CusF